MMDTRTMTGQEIRNAGLKVLRRELGFAGMIRFLQQFETRQSDYSRDRHYWLDELDAEKIARKILERRKDSNR